MTLQAWAARAARVKILGIREMPSIKFDIANTKTIKTRPTVQQGKILDSPLVVPVADFLDDRFR